MKHILISTIFLFFFNSLSAQTRDSTSNKLDARFFGSWSGSEKGAEWEGVSKYWIQHRAGDGTFLLLFTIIGKKGEVQNFAEKGKWWVDNGIFYELHFASGKTDTYSFDILDNEHIKFKLKSTDINFANENYEFIDTRIKDE